MSCLSLVLLIVLLLSSSEIWTARGENPAIKEEPLPAAGSRILVIAPHCDDETLGTGILLHRAVQNGLPVKVVIVTNGDGYAYAVDRDFYTVHPTSQEFIQFGYQRQAESIRAMRDLGVSRRDLVFLGYPDRGIAHLWAENWDADQPYHSQYTKAEADPYQGTFDPKVAYTGINLLRDLKAIVDDFNPTDIYFPHPNDAHVDHWAVNAFIKVLLESEDRKVREHLYIVHRGTWPEPRQPKPAKPMTPPPSLMNTGTRWTQLNFLPGEAVLKTDSILTYSTQVRVMKGFLLSFVRSTELYGNLPDFQVGILKADTGKKLGPAHAAIVDPVGDTLPGDVDRAADLKTIYCAVEGNNLVIEIEAELPVQNDISYHIRGRLFDANGTGDRFDLLVHDGKLAVNVFSKTSLSELPGALVEKADGRYRLTVPLQDIHHAKAVFLGADTSVGPYALDKAAWRMMRLPSEEK